MIGFVIVIPLITSILWILAGVFSFQILGSQIESSLQGIQWLSEIRESLLSWGVSLGSVITILIFLFLLFPLINWTSIVLMAAIALPWILKMLRDEYPQAYETDQHLSLASTWKLSARIFFKAIPLYLILLMLAWIPQLFLIGNFVLGAWVNAYFITAEVLSDISDEFTLKTWIRDHRISLFVMGCGTMALLAVPILQWITPVFAGLWFAHYILHDVNKI